MDYNIMNKITHALMIICIASVSLAGIQIKTGTLKGKIENEKGKPIAGAEVRALRSRDRSIKETKTDQAGNYSFELEPDDYTISFDADGYRGGNLVQMQQVEESKETVVKTIRLEKVSHRTSLIRGAVFDSIGASLPGVHLKLVRVPTAEEEQEHKHVSSFSMTYITNSHGEFAFRVPVTRARYEVTATLQQFQSQKKTVDVNGSESIPLAFSLEPVKK
jgi:Carboxypeptidase regulatory-like domain